MQDRLPDLVAVLVPRDTDEAIREALREVAPDDALAIRDTLARREQLRLDAARAVGIRTDVADWRGGGEWTWRTI